MRSEEEKRRFLESSHARVDDMSIVNNHGFRMKLLLNTIQQFMQAWLPIQLVLEMQHKSCAA